MGKKKGMSVNERQRLAEKARQRGSNIPRGSANTVNNINPTIRQKPKLDDYLRYRAIGNAKFTPWDTPGFTSKPKMLAPKTGANVPRGSFLQVQNKLAKAGKWINGPALTATRNVKGVMNKGYGYVARGLGDALNSKQMAGFTRIFRSGFKGKSGILRLGMLGLAGLGLAMSKHNTQNNRRY